jgi:DNA-binding transcriptional LysR family regulator
VGSKASLQEHTWVAPDESLSHLEQAKWLIGNVPAERIAVRVDSLVGMADAVQHGAGVGMLLCPLAQSRPGLVQIEPPDERLNTQIWILTHPDLKQVARVRAFTQFMFDALSSHGSLSH